MARLTFVSGLQQLESRKTIPVIEDTSEQTLSRTQACVLIGLGAVILTPLALWLCQDALSHGQAAILRQWLASLQWPEAVQSLGWAIRRLSSPASFAMGTDLLLWQLRIVVAGMIGLYTLNGVWQALSFKPGGPAHDQNEVTAEVLANRRRQPLPIITAMIPIREEGEVVLRRLATALARIDYPADRLQVLILLDEGAEETIRLVAQIMPATYQALIFEPIPPRSKPRVLNGALPYATGIYTVVWDVEDEPEPQQLLKAVVAFERLARLQLPQPVVCLQARLAFDLRRVQGERWWIKLLTAWQAAAYNWHFDGHEPSPGGTSNIIITDRLRQLGGWDAWNMAEDLNLGVWIARHGWQIGMLDSVTWEEPNTQLWNCIRQWSRWIKGRIQTYLAHTRHPVALSRELGWRGSFNFHMRVGLPAIMLLANPVFMAISVCYMATRAGLISSLFPLPILYAGNICLVAGNCFFIFATATASLRHRQYGLVPATLLSLGHWLLLSLAAYKAVWQLVFGQAHHWEATKHGLTRAPKPEQAPSTWRQVRPNLAILETPAASMIESEPDPRDHADTSALMN